MAKSKDTRSMYRTVRATLAAGTDDPELIDEVNATKLTAASQHYAEFVAAVFSINEDSAINLKTLADELHEMHAARHLPVEPEQVAAMLERHQGNTAVKLMKQSPGWHEFHAAQRKAA